MACDKLASCLYMTFHRVQANGWKGMCKFPRLTSRGRDEEKVKRDGKSKNVDNCRSKDCWLGNLIVATSLAKGSTWVIIESDVKIRFFFPAHRIVTVATDSFRELRNAFQCSSVSFLALTFPGTDISLRLQRVN